MIQSLEVGVQNSNTLGEVMRKEQATTASMTAEAVNTLAEEMKRAQAATASAITTQGGDVRRVVTKLDVTEEEVGAAKKFFEETNMRVEKVGEAIQEHAKKIQQMEEDLAKMSSAGGPAERITRRR